MATQTRKTTFSRSKSTRRGRPVSLTRAVKKMVTKNPMGSAIVDSIQSVLPEAITDQRRAPARRVRRARKSIRTRAAAMQRPRRRKSTSSSKRGLRGAASRVVSRRPARTSARKNTRSSTRTRTASRSRRAA